MPLKTDTRDEIEFATTVDGRKFSVTARGKVLAEDHTGRLELRDFDMDVREDDGVLERPRLRADLPDEWVRIEYRAEQRLYDDFLERREADRRG